MARTDRYNGLTASLAMKAPVQRALTTNSSLSGAVTVDGYTFQDGDRILLVGQTDQTENGIWEVNVSSAWQRAPDFDGNRDATQGTMVTALRQDGVPFMWRLNTPGPVQIGSSALDFQVYLNGSLALASGANPGDVRLFGASTSNTPAQNRVAIQAAVDSGELDIQFHEMYEVDKAVGLFVADFPNGDQPCIFVKNKTGMSIRGVGLGGMFVSNHAQGILEMHGCLDCDLENLDLEGPGDYPPLDGTTGSGEKGTPTIGYNTTFTGVWGAFKNNRLDTSANTAGGFGGVFPQYGGGTAGTWGMWNGGFIGNVALGLLIQNGCERITVRRCKASGFNYVGLSVGHIGDAAASAESKDIRFLDCVATYNQSTGINALKVDGAKLEGCVLSNNGHPDWLPSNTTAQAGYGCSMRGIPTYFAKNVIISGCLVEGNDRKGLDAHAGQGLHFVNNTIRNCGIQAISVPHTDATQPITQVVIKGNIIQNCSYANGELAVILGGGPIDGGHSYANSVCDLIIDGNLIIDCGGTGIEIKNGRNIQITNNILRGYDDRATGLKYFMFIGRLATVEPIYNLNCSGNVCDADGHSERYRGISVRYARNSQVNHNMIYMDQADVTEGLTLFSCTTTQAFGNVVYHNPASAVSVPLNLLATDGMTIGNYSDPDAGLLSYPLGFETTAGEREKAFRVPNIIQLDITFNGTVSPAYTVNAGEDYIASVQELAVYGVGITFKNMHSTVFVRSFMTEKSADGITTGGGFVGFIYERGLSHSGMEIGLKVTQTGANVLASNALTGTLAVTLMVF